ncbi:hypothetical protein ACEU07_18450, partial [Chromobacterium violaceum]|uniref:hypothetical protein n=1 Tax=Chromobacterium violaceum TaxID=536 RepID=UPI0035A6A327
MLHEKVDRRLSIHGGRQASGGHCIAASKPVSIVISGLQWFDQIFSISLQKGVDGSGVGAYSSPPQLTQRT